ARSPRSWPDRLAGAAGGAVAGFLLRDLAVESFASFWILFAIAGAVLWAGRLKTLVAGAVALLLTLWLAVAFSPLVIWMERGLVRRDAPRVADAVLVLASRLQGDGQPSAPALSRLVHALELVREMRTPHLVVTELPPPSGSYASVARELAGGLGLGPEVVSVGPVRRTRDEAVAAAALCRARGWRHLLLVTSPTHSRRACAAVERAGVEVTCSPSIETEFDVETLDRPSERILAFRSALHEWVGLLVYRWRGRLG